MKTIAQLMDLVWQELKGRHRGKKNIIAMDSLAAVLGVKSRRLQVAVHRLRTRQGKPIISQTFADDHGYYVADNMAEFMVFSRQMYHRLAATSSAVRAVENTAVELFGPQMALEMQGLGRLTIE